MNKSSILIFILLTVLFACNKSEKSTSDKVKDAVKGNVTIKGDLADGIVDSAVTVQLYDYRNQQGPKVVAHVKSDEKGDFTLKIQVDAANAYQLSIGKIGATDIILSPDETIHLTVKKGVRGLEFDFNGSKENLNLSKIKSFAMSFQDSVGLIQSKYKGIQPDDERLYDYFKDVDAFQKRFDNQLKGYIKEISPSYAGMIGLSLLNAFYHKQFYLDESQKYDSIKQPYAKDLIVSLPQIEAKLSKGDPAPDLALPSVKGGEIKVSDFKGKYLLLDFWASWCKPCRAENPNVVKTYKRFKSKEFEILGVSLDNNEQDWKKAITEDGLLWPQVSDLKGFESVAAKEYQISAIPSTYLIDPEGNILETNLRGPLLEYRLKELLD